MKNEQLSHKVHKDYPEFADEVSKLTAQELEHRIATYAKELEESETHKEENETLADLQDQVSEILGPYRDVKKAIRLKTRYIIALLNEK